MEVKAKLKHFRISPRKVRLVTNLVKGLDVEAAEQQLQFTNKAACAPILKLLRSAVANAINNYKLQKKGLKIKNILVNEGFTLKRWKPRAMGRATMIRKRSSHVTLILEGKEVKTQKKAKFKKQTDRDQDKKNSRKNNISTGSTI